MNLSILETLNFDMSLGAAHEPGGMARTGAGRTDPAQECEPNATNGGQAEAGFLG